MNYKNKTKKNGKEGIDCGWPALMSFSVLFSPASETLHIISFPESLDILYSETVLLNIQVVQIFSTFIKKNEKHFNPNLLGLKCFSLFSAFKIK